MMEFRETELIDRITRHFALAPDRLNRTHQADAELVDLHNGQVLAITTDALVEEIASGLYDEPYLMGWMLATANLSDLAAVGADPLGLLLTMGFPRTTESAFIDRLAEGASDACRDQNTYVLGGDTNQAESLLLSGCAVGLVPKDRLVTRIGAKPGDKVYLSAPCGSGSLYAWQRFSGDGSNPSAFRYQPRARLAEGKIVRDSASCCMDTSDGVLQTLDTLARLNHCAMAIQAEWARVIHPAALQMCRAGGLPAWLALAGVHGEFELCFTIPPAREQSFLRAAQERRWEPALLGEVRVGEGLFLLEKKRRIRLDTGRLSDLAGAAGGDPRGYISRIIDFAKEAGQ